MPTLDDLAKAKLDRALKKGGVIPAARADLVAIKAADFKLDAESGKFKNANGLTPKKFVKSLRETRPEIFDPLAADKMKASTNPFSGKAWNVSKQGALLRAVGPEKCAAIAASVGARIGDTKPNANY